MRARKRGALMLLVGVTWAANASADQLYTGGSWASVASDNKAQVAGDIVTILIVETASATNRVGTRTGKETSLDGGLVAGGVEETLSFGLDNRFRGMGETERSDRFVATMTAQVTEVLPTGNLLVMGKQNLFVNGEKRDIELRGQVRPIDISADNTVASSRIAEAEINYDGSGFVTRSAKPGLLNRIFSFLGL